MTLIGWVQIALVLAAVLAAAFPLGAWIATVLGGRRLALAPVERALYRAGGIDPERGMGWKSYAIALLVLSAVHFALLYAILRLQYWLPFNPQGFAGMSPKLAFNTAISFVTNTNWQAYSGEAALSNGAQMFGLTVHNFLSAAAGIAAAGAVARAFARAGTGDLGNFWVDLTRITLYVLLPLALVVTIVLIALGVPQTLAGSVDAITLEGAKQTIALGPVAFQEAIKLLGTNGGGFFNANSAHPFENPSAISNILENWSLLAIGFAMPIAFGRIVGRPRDGLALMITMAILLAAFTLALYAAEAAGNPLLHALGLPGGNMEGKEVRFGIPLSSLFTASTTATSTGAVIAAHDSLTPLGGMVTLVLMQLGEVIPGGVGSGLYGMLVFVLLTVFIAGLMVGRTPEYLGKKVEAREIKLAMLAVLILPLAILGGTAISLCTASGLGSLANAGPHGLSEMLYAWTSSAANNGSAFAGLSADTPLLDYGLGIAMLLGRFAYLVPVLAIAGSLAAKPKLAASAGTFPTHGVLFATLLAINILILGGLQFLPALSLGPLAEQFAMLAGQTY
ncbi:K+-transporting ATPase ATPase A chain [Endobacter medicaginis]|uniref:Potassium-transporting ATPase potassium-binding subunit n=1 Tax=Endobacter medicaginis TaxID=1181271 RepID=A0A839V037_9PROT|nr:potassium-transporting ATPase subunit KdpA [Endobacter medicaginis]MBB3174003.1 K+-transporting ATPase ATPase A chain [Endobacter medicaginis]MCX5475139.1 potassium-transporting ATPase subunit KdpA [Endobacter medicaginis]NVN30667.1 potassium-transporting ATPase subunit KdpA [Endobacter medicaginis]